MIQKGKRAQFYQVGKSLHRQFYPVALQFRLKKYLNPGDKISWINAKYNVLKVYKFLRKNNTIFSNTIQVFRGVKLLNSYINMHSYK